MSDETTAQELIDLIRQRVPDSAVTLNGESGRILIKHIDALQAVVDKLPKTEDGVHAVPGVDTVYAVDDRGTIWDSPIGFDDGFGKGYHSIRGFCRPVSECYSTRELAEAALAASHADTEAE